MFSPPADSVDTERHLRLLCASAFVPDRYVHVAIYVAKIYFLGQLGNITYQAMTTCTFCEVELLR